MLDDEPTRPGLDDLGEKLEEVMPCWRKWKLH
jgi:hypothetical protein